MILSKLKLVENIVNEISDNSTGQISPHDIRHNLLDIIDSVHLLTIGKPLSGSNFGTPAVRTTKAGESSLEKLGLDGYFSIDNSAFGYAALQANYQGVRNTAIGSNALSCNIYGEDNIAIGHNALGGNTIGVGNVGLGNFALNSQKSGNYNVAIGYAAGYYVDRNTNNKLFIASHANIDSDYMCQNPNGSGLIPLIHGDFSQVKVGIGVRTLGIGTLQIAGDVVPTPSGNLGHKDYPWQETYTDNIYLSGVKLNSIIDLNDGGVFLASGHFAPAISNRFYLGLNNKQWDRGYFNDLMVDGTLYANKLVAYDNCEYACKTIALGVSKPVNIIDGGGPAGLLEYQFEDIPAVAEEGFGDCAVLTDEELEGAGFTITTSGVGYTRTYGLTFIGPDYSLSCLQEDSPFTRASWNSNISLHLAKGSHLKTDRVMFPKDISLVSNSGCYGLFSIDHKLFLAKESLLKGAAPTANSGTLAGVGNVNFLSNSGELNNYVFSIAAIESGVSISQRFLTGTKKRVKDLANNGKDKLSGFEIEYIDESNSYVFGQQTDRLVIGSYDATSEPVQALTLMKNPSDEGIFGITNLAPACKYITPETSLNIRSISNAVARITAENLGNTKSAIQLLGKSNCLENGLELEYYTASGLSDLSIYKASGKNNILRFYQPTSTVRGSRVSLFPDFNDTNGTSMLSIGSQTYPYASVRMFEFVSDNNSSTPQSSPSGCVFFIKPKIAPQQSHSIYLFDGSGYLHNLIVNRLDSNDGRALCVDNFGNTYGGKDCIKVRNLATPRHNTLIGNMAGSEITSGSGNSIFGSNAGRNLTTSTKNVIIGHNSASGSQVIHNNIIIGTNSFNNTSSTPSHNIIIGNDGVGNRTSGNYNFIVGSSSGVILLNGKLGPTNSDKQLTMPSGGKLFINDNTDAESLSFRANFIDTIDYGGSDYPDNNLSFRFIGNSTATLLKLDHSSQPLSNSPNYFVPSPTRPYAELNGDLRLRGHIRFSDTTSLGSASFLNNINILESGLSVANSGINTLSTSLSSLVVEGLVPQEIKPAISHNVPSTGTLTVKNKTWNTTINVTLYNRDITSTIHAGAYVVAIKVNDEYKPIWISADDTACQCCPHG